MTFHKAIKTARISVLGLLVTWVPGGAADTLLFPALASNVPYVTTLVSVHNGPGGTSSHLQYVYRQKNTLSTDASPNHTGTCGTVQFTRPTSDGDLVTFDASGSLNSGNALYGDTDWYGGTFDLGIQVPTRSYLLVSNADAAGNPVSVGQVRDLAGEAVVMDIAFGAAWGMKAINDRTREDYTMINAADGGGVYSALPSQGFNNRRFAFPPPSEWTTRFFVTPIGPDMHTANHSASVNLVTGGATIEGLFDRQGNRHTFTPISRTVTCTGAVDLRDLVDSTTWAAVEQVGGWSWLRVASGDAAVYKLEYVVENSTYGGTNNSGYLLSGYDL